MQTVDRVELIGGSAVIVTVSVGLELLAGVASSGSGFTAAVLLITVPAAPLT